MVLLSVLLRQIDSRRSLRSRRMWIVGSIVPLFVPELLLGFNYRLTATQLSAGADRIVAAAATEGLYGLIQLSRCLAVGVAVSLLLPQSPVTGESLYSWKLLRSSMKPVTWRLGWSWLHLTGPWLRLILSWSLMALIVFQEFETAALMQIDRHPIAWTVWLFDAHAAYQPLQQSLRMMLTPLFCELCLLLPALCVIGSARTRTSDIVVGHSSSGLLMNADGQTNSRRKWFWALICLSPGLVLCVIVPIWMNMKPAIAGLMAMVRNSFLLRQSSAEIGASIAFSFGATFLSMSLAAWVLRQQKSRRTMETLRMGITLLPGLLGSLVLSLTLLAMFQTSALRVFYDTWFPMLLGLTLAVFPRALAVVLLLQRNEDRAAIHSAMLLKKSTDRGTRSFAAATVWRLSTARWLLGGLVVAHWCFWDVTSASILHPVTVEPVVTRLYNEMHYGRTEALMSVSFVSSCAPAFVWLLAMGASRLLAHGRSLGRADAISRARETASS